MQLTNIVRVGALLLTVSHAFALPRGFDVDSSTGELLESSELTFDDAGDAMLGEMDADESVDRSEDAVAEVVQEDTAPEDEIGVVGEVSGALDLEDDAAGANATVAGMDEDLLLASNEWPEPFTPTCESNAMRAMWKWRADCDSITGRFKRECWVRAPSPKVCCNQDLAWQPDYKPLTKTVCRRYWPYKWEQWFCAKDCGVDIGLDDKQKVTKDSCDFGGSFDNDANKKVNNPARVCRCMVKKCPK